MVSFFDSILDVIAMWHGGSRQVAYHTRSLCWLGAWNFYLNIILSGLSFANYYIGICSFIFGV